MTRNGNPSFVFRYNKFIHLVGTMAAYGVKDTMQVKITGMTLESKVNVKIT